MPALAAAGYVALSPSADLAPCHDHEATVAAGHAEPPRVVVAAIVLGAMVASKVVLEALGHVGQVPADDQHVDGAAHGPTSASSSSSSTGGASA